MAAGASRPNPLGLGFVAIGDRWNLLILREALQGARHFRDWVEALGVSDPVLAARLRDLSGIGLLEREPVEAGGARGAYRLTPAGRAIWPVFVAIWLWDLRWTGTPELFAGQALRHEPCGYATLPLLGCRACGACGVTPAETSVEMRPEYSYDDLNPARAYRRSATRDGAQAVELGAIELLGDRWSTSVLSAAMLGARRFQDYQRAIETIRPVLLSDRIGRFVEHGVLSRQPVSPGGRRMEYRLTAKGLDFFGVLATAIAWASANLSGRGGTGPTTIRHRPCGQRFDPVYVCNACSGVLDLDDVRFARRP